MPISPIDFRGLSLPPSFSVSSAGAWELFFIVIREIALIGNKGNGICALMPRFANFMLASGSVSSDMTFIGLLKTWFNILSYLASPSSGPISGLKITSTDNVAGVS